MADTEEIVLGSGRIYMAEFTGTMPDLTTVAVDANELGEVTGGAVITYTAAFYTAKSDLGKASKTVLTDEDVVMKSGVMTFNGKTFEKMCATARITETATLRTVKFGGLGNDNKKQYVILFVHEDPVEGDIRVAVVGKNQKGFELTFLKDKETIIDAEFKASPMDSEGTLLIYEEDIPPVV